MTPKLPRFTSPAAASSVAIVATPVILISVAAIPPRTSKVERGAVLAIPTFLVLASATIRSELTSKLHS